MADEESTILEAWPAIKKDLHNFLSDTDAWIISEIKSAYETRDWDKIEKLIDVMDTVHNLSHGH